MLRLGNILSRLTRCAEKQRKLYLALALCENEERNGSVNTNREIKNETAPWISQSGHILQPVNKHFSDFSQAGT